MFGPGTSGAVADRLRTVMIGTVMIGTVMIGPVVIDTVGGARLIVPLEAADEYSTGWAGFR